VRPRPQLDASEPNRAWRYDATRLPTHAGDYHLVPVIDACSRKITARHFGAEFTSASPHGTRRSRTKGCWPMT
jgi:hypothetical protein